MSLEDNSQAILSSRLSVIGTAVKNDGPSASLTAPNGATQKKLINSVKMTENVSGLSTTLEAHGTGTTLGDPIEIGAALKALGSKSLPGMCCSSLKANMGHLESAASGGGILSVISSSLHHSQIGPNSQLRILNPHVFSLVKTEIILIPVQTMILI